MFTSLYIALVILFALISWRNLKLGLFVLMGLLPIYLLRLEILGVPSTMLEILIWILVFVWIVKGLKERRWKMSRFRIHDSGFKSFRVPITLILIAAVISTFIAPDTFAALGILKAYFIEPLLVFVLASSILKRDDLPKLFKALGVSALILSLIAIAQKFTGLGIPEPWDTARRVTSIFSYPNALGLFLAPILATVPILLARAIRKNNLGLKLFWSLTFVAGVVALVLSETHAAWIAIPASLFLLLILISSKRVRAMSLVTTAVVALAFGVLAFQNPSSILQPLSSLDVRVSQWQETGTYLIDNHWLLGAGLSAYPEAIEPYHEATHYEIFQYPHNILLNFWVELGLLGLIGFIWLGVQISRLAKQNKNDLLVLAASAGLIEMLIHGLVDAPYFKNDLAVLTWLLIAIMLIAKSKNSISAD